MKPFQLKNPLAKTPGTFLVTFGMVFLLSLSAADSVGAVPYYVDGTQPAAARTASGGLAYAIGSIEPGVSLSTLPVLGGATTAPAAPVRIVASSIGLDLPVGNPTTTDVDALDALLESEVVRYPSSALAGQDGNVLVFGHSSHLPIVHNHFYQAFNGLPDLKQGAIISLISADGTSYDYQVEDVEHVDATDTYIDLSNDGTAKLTLSTCDTLSAKTARWVVHATFIGASNTAQ
ncbi:MAG TPA: sortase [Candidatus Paceibacterota bacterium]|nr:sortase [Candidatus Paceibacterota bacterium]